jgi:hypothetical protein
MATLTLGTFNLNNLFDRWNFAGALEARQQGVRTVDATFVFDDPAQRRLQLDSTGRLLVPKPATDTARIAERIDQADVDVWVVEEVENRDALAEFNRTHLASPYPHSVVVDGNDALRFIDVGILSRHPLGAVTNLAEGRASRPARRARLLPRPARSRDPEMRTEAGGSSPSSPLPGRRPGRPAAGPVRGADEVVPGR